MDKNDKRLARRSVLGGALSMGGLLFSGPDIIREITGGNNAESFVDNMNRFARKIASGEAFLSISADEKKALIEQVAKSEAYAHAKEQNPDQQVVAIQSGVAVIVDPYRRTIAILNINGPKPLGAYSQRGDAPENEIYERATEQLALYSEWAKLQKGKGGGQGIV